MKTKSINIIDANTLIQNKKRYVGIYVHIPFCNAKCFYCNFNSYVIDTDKANQVHNDYLQAVCKEIESYKDLLKNKIVNTIFIGGGTPSIMSGKSITTILGSIKSNFTVLDNAEITIEINPSSFNENDCKMWYEAGVNRVSIGLQTSNDKILKAINRTHTKLDFHNTMQSLKKAGFTNISADLIIGLPFQTLKDIKSSLKYVLSHNVSHISVYSLILEDDSVLAALVKKGKLTLPNEDDNVKFYTYTNKYLSRRKFNRYEVSNFCKNDKYSRHNVNCWDMFEYVGMGAGAHSYFNSSRWSNVKTIHTYINNINTLNHAKEYTEEIDNQEKFEETLLLGLRMTKGVSLDQIKLEYGIDLLKEKNSVISKYKKLGFIDLQKNNLFVTSKGFYVLNKIILDLVD